LLSVSRGRSPPVTPPRPGRHRPINPVRQDSCRESSVRTEPSHPVLRPSAGALRAEWPELSGALRRATLRAVMLTFGRLVTVEGAERLAEIPEPAIFALNHSNALEAVLAPCVLIHLRQGRLLHFLADWMYLHVPVVGWVIRQCEPIPVYGKPARWRIGEAHRLERRKRQSVVEACLGRLAAGGSLGIFPEGTRNPDPVRLGKGRSGLGEIALRSAAPVVPVGLHYPAAGRLGRTPRVGRLVLRIGEPMTFQAEQDRREIVSRVMDALQELCQRRAA
jgi:1-acyl-sn-glycerol-3-phosphate acyltransferase